MSDPIPNMNTRGSIFISIALYIVLTGFMALLRLEVFATQFISLTYGLPLLVCLWHKDRRLLWAMAVTFMAMASYKALVLIPSFSPEEGVKWLQLYFQIVNIVVIGAATHAILNLTDRLKSKNVELESANEELSARQEEITRQNEELQSQSEELAHQNEELQQQGEELNQQNEELQQQSEELGQQSEELQAHTEELQNMNQELSHREDMLQIMFTSMVSAQNQRELVKQICPSLITLLGDGATAAAIVERRNDKMAIWGASESEVDPREASVSGSFAAIVMDQNRTAYIDDLAARPDLKVSSPDGRSYRSVLATPLRLNGNCVGVIKVFSSQPQQWTTQQFRIIEWASAQCSLALEIFRLQEDLSNANTKLETLVKDRTAKLQELVNELEHFSYTITHDMRAPLRAMQGFAGMMEEMAGSDMDAEMKMCLDRISISATRMDSLITDALSYSKAVRQELVLAPVDIHRLLQGIIDSYPDFQSPKARIEIAQDLPLVLGNEAGLTQCFSNLLGNAVKFVAPGTVPHVRVRAEVINGVTRLWFEDNGIGIPGALQSQIFQMFQRVSKDYEGTGVGLALVRKVMERMGGRVGVESEPGAGSRFWLELKLATGQAVASNN